MYRRSRFQIQIPTIGVPLFFHPSPLTLIRRYLPAVERRRAHHRQRSAKPLLYMTSTSWLSRSQRDHLPPSFDIAGFNLHHPSSHQVSLSPSYIPSRAAPEHPLLNFQKPSSSSFKGLQNVFNKRNLLGISHSATSLPSAFQASLSSFQSENTTIHPYASMAPPPLPVVSNHDADEEDECPVCLEPLSFSFRLPGEKPHIVPECGHALHEVSIRLRRLCFDRVFLPRLFASDPRTNFSIYTGMFQCCIWPTTRSSKVDYSAQIKPWRLWCM